MTIAIDGWTNVRHTKVTNILLLTQLSGGVAYYWCSITNTYAANTAVWLESVLTPVLQQLVTLGVRFAALVADNEAVNDALWKHLLEPFPFLIRIPCAAHTIQLVVRQVMEFVALLLLCRRCQQYCHTLRRTRRLVCAFAHCKQASLPSTLSSNPATLAGTAHFAHVSVYCC